MSIVTIDRPDGVNQRSAEWAQPVVVNVFISACMASVPALSLIVSSGYSYGPGSLLLLAVFVWLLPQKLPLTLSKDDTLILLAFLLYFVIHLIFMCMDGYHIRDLDRPSRFLFAGVVFLLLIRYSPDYSWLIYGCILGAIAGGFFGVYQYFILGAHRAHGFLNPIYFGSYAMVLGLITFAASAYFLSQKKQWLALMTLPGCAMGLMASFLSATRGSWLSLPLLIFILWLIARFFTRKYFVIMTTVGFFMIVFTAAAPNFVIKERIDTTVDHLHSYLDNTDRKSPTGVRIELWRSAYYSFLSSPVFGVGRYVEPTLKQQHVALGWVDPEVLQYQNAHNDYLNALSLQGIIGLCALLTVYLLPLWLFIKRINTASWPEKIYPLSGALVIVNYMIFGLTHAHFSNNSGVIVYSFLVIFFWSASRKDAIIHRETINH